MFNRKDDKMKIERWEEENDEEWAERLAEEITLADNAETTHYFVERDPYDEEGIIINYVGGSAITWKEHPEGPFKATQIIKWKNKATRWDALVKDIKEFHSSAQTARESDENYLV